MFSLIKRGVEARYNINSYADIFNIITSIQTTKGNSYCLFCKLAEFMSIIVNLI